MSKLSNAQVQPRGWRPDRRPHFAGAGLALAAAVALALAPALPARAWHLPWHHRRHASTPATVAVAGGLTVRLQDASGSAAVPQSWERNTLLVDLTHLGGSGTATLTPPPSGGWPARLAFRVQPGSIATLEVQGAQRVQYTVPARGSAMTVQLDPGVYVVRTPSLTLHWSAADGLPH